jgi:hypothetical protein
MYHNLGIHWASSIPAFLTLLCMPFPLIMYRYGEAVRMKCKYVVHLCREKRKHSAHDRAEDGSCSQDRGRIDGVSVDQIVHDWQDDQHSSFHDTDVPQFRNSLGFLYPSILDSSVHAIPVDLSLRGRVLVLLCSSSSSCLLQLHLPHHLCRFE